MAEPIEIRGSSYTGKIRNPLIVIGLTLITLGIYGIFWYYYANKELAEIGKAHNTTELGDSPGTSVLAVTLGALIIVPAFVSAYKFCKRLQTAAGVTGAPEGMEAGLLFIIYVFVSPVGAYIAQSNLNKVLEAQAGGAGGALGAGAGAAVTSPESPVVPPR